MGGTTDNKSGELDILSLLVPVSPAPASLGWTQRGGGEASEAVIPRPGLCLHHPAPVGVHQQVEGVVVGVAQQAPAQVLPGGPVLPHHLGVSQVPGRGHAAQGEAAAGGRLGQGHGGQQRVVTIHAIVHPVLPPLAVGGAAGGAGVPGPSSEVGVAGVGTAGHPPHPGIAPQLVLVAGLHILCLGVDRLDPGPGPQRVQGVECRDPAWSSSAHQPGPWRRAGGSGAGTLLPEALRVVTMLVLVALTAMMVPVEVLMVQGLLPLHTRVVCHL